MADNSDAQGTDKSFGVNQHVLGKATNAHVGQINANANSGPTWNGSHSGNGFLYLNQSKYESGASHFNPTGGGTTNIHMGGRSRSRSPRREPFRSREAAPFGEDGSGPPVSPRSQSTLQSPDHLHDASNVGTQQTSAGSIAAALHISPISVLSPPPDPVLYSPASQDLSSPHPSYPPPRECINPYPSPQQTPDRGRSRLNQVNSAPAQDALPLDWHGPAPRKYHAQNTSAVDDARGDTQPPQFPQNSASTASHGVSEGKALPQGSVHNVVPEQASILPPQQSPSSSARDIHRGAEDAQNDALIRELPRSGHEPQSGREDDDEGRRLEVQSLGESIVEPEGAFCAQTEERKKRSIFKRCSHWFAKRLIGLARKIEPSAT